MGSLTRKICNATPCRRMPFFRTASQRGSADEAFFEARLIQRQPNGDDEKKDPLTEGLKTTGERLLEHKPFKEWYDPKLHQLELTLWDAASPADKAAMLAFLGMNLGTAATAFAVDPKIRAALSDVNIGKPLGWIPYSPIEGFKYTRPTPGMPAYGFSADFTLADYLALLRKKYQFTLNADLLKLFPDLRKHF